MSAIASVYYLDGQPVAPAEVEAITAAMPHRAPDGFGHWRCGAVALGQCVFRTTPESLEEVLPLANEDESLVLVMDGRVDNREDLRRTLLRRGAVLRTRADAELVLRAYEIWGDACVDHVVGECVFMVWDARHQRLFAARDVAGTRHFYYHADTTRFVAASEIKGLRVVPGVGVQLNDARLLDYLVGEFDREDQMSTAYKGIHRLPAGHAMVVSAQGVRTWRYWHPGNLAPQRFASFAECAEAFMAQLREAVRCRLRSLKPLGAMLSGGLDSSTIVGLIANDLRDQVSTPLHTFTLTAEDRTQCPDTRSARQIVDANPWLRPHFIEPAEVDRAWSHFESRIAHDDEPFAIANELPYDLVYQAAADVGCGVVFDGLAGDLLFYDVRQSLQLAAQHGRYRQIPNALAGYKHHHLNGALRDLTRSLIGRWIGPLVPDGLRALIRRRRDERLQLATHFKLLQVDRARQYLRAYRSSEYLAGQRHPLAGDGQSHAQRFMRGLISMAHEVYGLTAFSKGVEPRSPMSDRRVIEFALRMPPEAKSCSPRYKQLLRDGTAGLLPDAVRSRDGYAGGHPGGDFHSRLLNQLLFQSLPVERGAGPWGEWQASYLRAKELQALQAGAARGDDDASDVLLRYACLARWMQRRVGETQ